VDHSIRDALPFIEANVMGTYRLLEDARRNKVKRYIQVSTDEVYGAILNGAYTEDSRLNPTNPYAASKAGADALAISYAHTYKLHTTVTRTENNYGPWQHPQKALPVFTKAANKGLQLPVYGDGLHSRQWLWVDDHVDGILTLLQKDITPGEVYHVAGNQELTNLDLAKKILRYCGKPEDHIRFVPDHDIRPGHDRRYALVCDKLRALGWEPKVSLDVGLAEAVTWYSQNQWWSE
jgi:dTDP-glucose 4,6-dehydratase